MMLKKYLLNTYILKIALKNLFQENIMMRTKNDCSNYTRLANIIKYLSTSILIKYTLHLASIFSFEYAER